MRDCPKWVGQCEGKLNTVVAESEGEEAQLSSLMLFSGMQVIDEGSDVTEMGHGAPTVEKSLAGKQPSVGHGELTYAKDLASAVPSNGSGVPGKLAAEGRVVDEQGPVKKGSAQQRRGHRRALVGEVVTGVITGFRGALCH